MRIPIFPINMKEETNPWVASLNISWTISFWLSSRISWDDSGRSNECIDFTIIPSLKRKLNLVGTLGGQKLKIFNIFEMNREKPQKNEEKTRFFTQNQFTSKSNFLFCYNSKTNRCKYLKFSPNVYISALRTHSNLYEICQNCENLQVILWLENLLKIWYKILHKFFFKYLVDKIFLALSKYLKIYFKVPHIIHKHNFFLLAFEVQILTKIR
ncbi:hypothetical protein AGLY_007537 [Aphis glycines]|uniref:Uncharacterized protein n=1 Tax=Aphis glycines TaxID=307491 RepID=A0A6G0TPJ6_APHGL|nr:hypothetical protein AGLY_007537 [Aphis glycines]